MAALEHTQHEHFARALAAGVSPLTAYVACGYQRDPDAAEALACNPRIAARVDELRREKRRAPA